MRNVKEYLITSFANRISKFGIQPIIFVYFSCCLLQNTKCFDDR